VVAATWPLACGDGDRSPLPGRPRAADGAAVVAERRVGPRIVDLTVRSPALGGTGKVRLLTPPGWSTGRERRRWPTLYLLHGCCDAYDSWTRETDIEELPALRRVLVVMPEGGEVGFYSNWRGDGKPAWESYHLGELRQILERGYGAGARRAVAGLSMGGLGAMDYAARHPGLFRAAASFSGLLHPLEDVRFYLNLFSAHTDDPLDIWGDPDRQRRVWAAHDPTELAARLQGARLFVSAGDGRPGPFEQPGQLEDAVEATVYREGRAFARRLRRLHIPVEADFYGHGVHDWPYWARELERSLPLLLGALGVRPLRAATGDQPGSEPERATWRNKRVRIRRTPAGVRLEAADGGAPEEPVWEVTGGGARP
jgi:diacylglycerol O-acyltransferase / trehalose O-mycolyltransferase